MNILKYLKLRYQILVFPIIFMITLGVVYKFVHSSNALIGKELKTVRYNYIPYNDFTNRMLGTQASIKKSFQDAVAAQDSSKLETSSILATEFKALVDSAKSVHLGDDHALLDSTLESFDVYFSAANRASQLMLQEKYNTEMSENAKIMVAELKTLEHLLAQVTAQEVDEAFENADYQLELLGANIRRVLFISLFIFLGLSFLISFSLTTAIKKTVYYIKELSEGNLSIIIPKGYLNRRDEIGDILKAVHALNTKLKEVILGVQQESSQILEISQQLEMTSNHLANGSNEQAEFVDKISSTMEQVSSKITLNAQNANETSVISNEANLKLKEVGEKSKEAISANERITNRISQINDIAFQTNLLALNAAIEAARAGEAGKGFAVVASEVQTLAKKSGTVADEINNLTKTAYNLSSEAGEVMFDIIPEIERTSILVGEIAFSSEEQSSGASEVNESIQKLNELSQTSAASSEELAATAENLLLQSKRLQESISFYRMEATKKAPNLPSPTHSKASTLSDFDLEMDEEDVVFAF